MCQRLKRIQVINCNELKRVEGRLKVAKAELLGVGKLLERRAEEFKGSLPQGEARARMLYDAAWVARAGLVGPPARWHVLAAPLGHVGAEPVECRRDRHGHAEVARRPNNPVRPRRPIRSVNATRVAARPSGSRRSGWLWRDTHDRVVSSQKPMAPCS